MSIKCLIKEFVSVHNTSSERINGSFRIFISFELSCAALFKFVQQCFSLLPGFLYIWKVKIKFHTQNITTEMHRDIFVNLNIFADSSTIFYCKISSFRDENSSRVFYPEAQLLFCMKKIILKALTYLLV